MSNLSNIETLLVLDTNHSENGIGIGQEQIDQLKSLGISNIYVYPEREAEEIPLEILKRVDLIYCGGMPLVPKTWNREKLKSLKWIQLARAGFEGTEGHPLYDSKDSKDSKEENSIIITNVSGIHVVQIPEQVIGYIIAINRKFQNHILNTKNLKKWIPGQFMSQRELRGSTIGILGYGNIGREIGRLGKAFGCDILACTTSGKKTAQEGYIVPGTGDIDGSIPTKWYSTDDSDSFNEFLSKSQILIICLPLTPKTRHIINSSTLSLLPPSSILINIGRGGLIDTSDLLNHLDSKQSKLFGVALDVTEPEPLPEYHPLFSHPKVLLTPHVAGGTPNYFKRCYELFFNNVRKAKSGEELWNVYDSKKGY